jgi:hypothetical protein
MFRGHRDVPYCSRRRRKDSLMQIQCFVECVMSSS